MATKNYDEMTLAELREEASQREISGRSSMDKAALIAALSDQPPADGGDETPEPGGHDTPDAETERRIDAKAGGDELADFGDDALAALHPADPFPPPVEEITAEEFSDKEDRRDQATAHGREVVERYQADRVPVELRVDEGRPGPLPEPHPDEPKDVPGVGVGRPGETVTAGEDNPHHDAPPAGLLLDVDETEKVDQAEAAAHLNPAERGDGHPPLKTDATARHSTANRVGEFVQSDERTGTGTGVYEHRFHVVESIDGEAELHRYASAVKTYAIQRGVRPRGEVRFLRSDPSHHTGYQFLVFGVDVFDVGEPTGPVGRPRDSAVRGEPRTALAIQRANAAAAARDAAARDDAEV